MLYTAGSHTVYLRPKNSTDTLITVWVKIVGPRCGYGLTAVDQDGNVYNTVRIGNLCWTRENLVTLHYAQDGSEVPGAAVYFADLSPDVAGNLATYGRLYSWYSAAKVPENDNITIPYADLHGNAQGLLDLRFGNATFTSIDWPNATTSVRTRRCSTVSRCCYRN